LTILSDRTRAFSIGQQAAEQEAPSWRHCVGPMAAAVERGVTFILPASRIC
jgi:hypothetical protein